jgi:phosphohistidine phosphatase
MMYMVDNIVLFRHGKAQDKGSSIPDEFRQLTEEGIVSLQSEMIGLMNMLPEDLNIQIWASPLKRSLETAEIIDSYLKSQNIIIYDFIGSGAYSALINELRTCSKDMVLIAGHEPWLGDWSKRMTGCQLPFKKGAAALLKPDSSFDKFDISWFLQPYALAELSCKIKR